MSKAETCPRAMSRRKFLRYHGIASSALTFSPFFIDRIVGVCHAAASLVKVYKVMNGDCFQNTAKIWEMLGGPAKFIGPTDVVVIKGNAQWYNQGYTHTGAIKAVIDAILQIPSFSGEVVLCDNVQGEAVGIYGFDVPASKRVNNWPDMNWNELGTYYASQGKPVGTVKWLNDSSWRTPPTALPCFSLWNPAAGPGWTRYFFTFNGRNTYLSYPVFRSPITPGRMIDMKNGVWENGSYTGRKVKAIFMPTLNNHSYFADGSEDYAGATSAVKSFFGATEVYHGPPGSYNDDYVWNGFYNIHANSYTQYDATAAGKLTAKFINNLYAPALYITPAIYSGWFNRTSTGGAAYTNTVLACLNPVSLDYVACRDVLSKCGSPARTFLDPSTQNNNTWRQLAGCSSEGIGTTDPQQMEVITFDFNNPSTTRLDIDRKVRDFKAGVATEQDVKDVITQYMQGH